MEIELKYEKGTVDGKVICQECGVAYSLITPSHLATHDITFSEYQKLYPDCPISAKAYKVARFEQRDSIIFFDTEDTEKEIEEIEEKYESNLPPPTELNLKATHEDKIKILEYLHLAYPHLENNYFIEKLDPHGMMTYKFITDTADPIQKIIFDFPEAYWHNTDFAESPNKFDILEKDGWEITIVKGSRPTIKNVQDCLDFIIG